LATQRTERNLEKWSFPPLRCGLRQSLTWTQETKQDQIQGL